MNLQEFLSWLDLEFDKYPMLAKSNPRSVNELAYVLRHSDRDFSINWNTDKGFASIPTIREAFIPSRYLALKVEVIGYDEDVIDGETYYSITVKILEEPSANKAEQFEPGDEIYAVARDEDGVPCDVNGLIFLARVGDYAIASIWVDDLQDPADILAYHADETTVSMDTHLCVYPLSDCFASAEDARALLPEG